MGDVSDTSFPVSGRGCNEWLAQQTRKWSVQLWVLLCSNGGGFGCSWVSVITSTWKGLPLTPQITVISQCAAAYFGLPVTSYARFAVADEKKKLVCEKKSVLFQSAKMKCLRSTAVALGCAPNSWKPLTESCTAREEWSRGTSFKRKMKFKRNKNKLTRKLTVIKCIYPFFMACFMWASRWVSLQRANYSQKTLPRAQTLKPNRQKRQASIAYSIAYRVYSVAQ